MIKIAICDDDTEELKHIQDMIDMWTSSHGCTIHAYPFEKAEALINQVIIDNRYDLYILDILMPEMNGIELGSKLRTVETAGHDTPIIYLTSSPEFAVESYEVRAFFYLLKPVAYDKFDKILTNAVRQVEKNKVRTLPVRTKSGTYPVTYDEIYYIMLEARALSYVCFDRKIKSITIPGSFKSATAQLAMEPQFFPCGTSILVNLGQIKVIDKNELTFSNDVRLTIPRSSTKSLYKAWLDFWLE
ncbi:MAG: response regulator transcription factor [Lachnospiraceae bacterium]|nr:response regulator transcription factor [Lachnospiraceae bacterium]